MARQIIIPFAERFRVSMLDGTKIYTTRTRCYGQPVDSFHAFGAVFVLESVKRVYLYRVSNYLYMQEGFNTPAHFVTFWNSIHPNRLYHQNDLVYLHRFFR